MDNIDHSKHQPIVSEGERISILRHPRTAIRRFLESRKTPISEWGAHAFEDGDELLKFQRSFDENLKNCIWKPHRQYSVFTQYDQDFYLKKKRAFLHKYRCFYAVSKTIEPRRIIELGSHAGSGADAYMSAAPQAAYVGFDQFEDGVLHGVIHKDGTPWQPLQIATRLFEARGFKNYKFMKADLRSMDELPCSSDFVVVDAAHDPDNEYADLQLALTAKPTFIFVDDSDDPIGAAPAIEKFLEDLKGRVKYFCGIPYYGGGLVIKLKINGGPGFA